ncbi:MAG: phospholipase D family protein [Proteobacteria bacterium]|nr:phospholipase D family protein [Pseudomonadota bacterium]
MQKLLDLEHSCSPAGGGGNPFCWPRGVTGQKTASPHWAVPFPLVGDVLGKGGAATACLLLLLCLFLCACSSLRPRDLDRAQALADAARPTALDCANPNGCAQDSPLRDLADRAIAQSTPTHPVNYVDIVEYGQDSLQARINLIRSARSTIDLQTYIFSHDDSGYLFLNELLAAARRGVQVRLLVDQLFGPSDPDLLAVLATANANFRMRLYNPTFDRARTTPLGYVGAIACCFRRFNQRMHIKQMVVDGVVGITGGRNIDDHYFDWSTDLAYRDRDAILAGPSAAEMQWSFDQYWNSPRSVPIARLQDVAAVLLAHGGAPPRKPLAEEHRSPRVLAMAASAADESDIDARFVQTAHAVADVHFIADTPAKQERMPTEGGRATGDLRGLIESAQHTVLLQTPYLVLTRGARKMFRAMRQRPDPPTVTISTNSLASTDNLPVFALAWKYSRRNLHELGFHIYQIKPDAPGLPVEVDADDAAAPPAGQSARKPRRLRVPSDASRFPGLGLGSKAPRLRTSGLRISLHAKSMVIDGHIGMIGSHNFDPRSDNYNTEGVLVFDDPTLAQQLQAAIEQDMAPENSWLTARRPHDPLTPLTGRIGHLFEKLPLFDFWPFRYSTNYELVPGCEPVPVGDPRFAACWTPVGSFPEVRMSFKVFTVRVLTAFGAGLAPIL